MQAGLSCPAIEVKVAATLFIVEMVEYLDKKDWAPLATTLPVLIQVIKYIIISWLIDAVIK